MYVAMNKNIIYSGLLLIPMISNIIPYQINLVVSMKLTNY